MEDEEQRVGIQSDEQRQELEYQALCGSRVDQMVGTKGWKEIVFPLLKKRLEGQYRLLVNSNDPDQIIRVQQGIREIETIFTMIDSAIENGKAAGESLQADRKRE